MLLIVLEHLVKEKTYQYHDRPSNKILREILELL